MRQSISHIRGPIGPRRGPVWLVAALVSLATLPAAAEDPIDPLSYDRNIRGLFQRYCYDCHRSDDPSGDVSLDDENIRVILTNRRTWEKVRRVLESREMPPEDERQPDDEQRELMIRFIDVTLDQIDCDGPVPPKTPSARRLTRNQYNHAVADLTGLDLRVADRFSPDPVSYGFAGIGGSAGLSQVLIDQYTEAAKQIVAALLASKASRPDVYERHFGDAAAAEGRRDFAKASLTRFAQTAFRRPVEDELVGKLLHVYDTSLTAHGEHDRAVADAMRAVLMSPRFFMRIESTQQSAEGIYPVDDFDLASRLSFFLWSSPPDQTLMELAAAGELKSDDVLIQQTRRLLDDPRTMGGLVDEYFGQWLQFNQLTEHQVDAETFPDYDDGLAGAMIGEVRWLIRDILRNDLPVATLLDADFTYVNAALAEHYGIDPVADASTTGPGSFDNGDPSWVRIALKDRRRGGLLTSAALLTLQADPGRTNIPRRGNYIAGTFLGDPPPPPPPDVPPLKEPAAGDVKRTLREVFELHRSSPECSACHAKMDAIGFALENFDAIGRYRTTDAGLPIDSSGDLPGGEHLQGPEGLKDYVLSQQQRFIRTMSENLLVYALGRPLEPEDDCLVREIVANCEQDGGKVSSIVKTIVLSAPFRYRQDTVE